jgi:hypothetical protein
MFEEAYAQHPLRCQRINSEISRNENVFLGLVSWFRKNATKDGLIVLSIVSIVSFVLLE